MWLSLLLLGDPLDLLIQTFGVHYKLVLLPYLKATLDTTLMMVCVFFVTLQPYYTLLECVTANNITSACLSQRGINLTEQAVGLRGGVDRQLQQLYASLYRGHSEL